MKRDLAVVEPWFDDPKTRARLGGRCWPRQRLRLATLAPDARIARLVTRDGEPAGLFDIEIEPGGRASFACVTAPELRRRGVAAGALKTLLSDSDLAGVTTFVAGVERGNAASEALLRSVDFISNSGFDEDGFRVLHLSRDR